jgi:hypothetical protein
MTYVLIYEYSDRSAFKVCGVTGDKSLAKAWFYSGRAAGNRENSVYEIPMVDIFATSGYTKWDVAPL